MAYSVLSSPVSPEETLVQRELIGSVRGLVQALGFSRSLGEIYGFLYVAVEPQSMEQIRHGLGVSLGSVSQGLKQLRELKAVRVVYVPGERKDFFAAETELRRFVGVFFREVLLPQIDESQRRLEALRPAIAQISSDREHYRSRYEKMYQWHQTSRRWLGRINRILKP